MLIIGNGRLITRDAEHPYFERGAVVCDGGTIVAAGDEAELRAQYPGAEYLDSRGGVIMPGLINAHTSTPASPAVSPSRATRRRTSLRSLRAPGGT